MTPEEIQQAWETKSHCEQPLKVSFYETDESKFVELFCANCFVSLVKQIPPAINVDEVLENL